jgi:hypothetical protein
MAAQQARAVIEEEALAGSMAPRQSLDAWLPSAVWRTVSDSTALGGAGSMCPAAFT